ncbi:RNA polymerase sigma factor [Planctomycetota bacterium]
MLTSEDRRWIRELNQGDREAWRRIYEKYRVRMFTVALALTGRPDLAEDCLQDVFVRLAERAGDLKVRSSLSGYLSAALLNRARDVLRRAGRQVSEPVEDLGCSSPAPSPLDRLIRDEQVTALVRALGQLPLEQREVFILHNQARLAFRAIARQQEISLRTAHSRYRYAIEKLRSRLCKEVNHGR